jgi:hypothetical protein
VDNCEHEFCFECIRRYIVAEIGAHHYPISCPGCVAGKTEGEPQSKAMRIPTIPFDS